MRPWAKNILTVLSLLIFVGSVTLWVRSYFVSEMVWWEGLRTATQTLSYHAVSGRGTVGILRVRYERLALSHRPAPGWSYIRADEPRGVHVVSLPDSRLRVEWGPFQLLSGVRTGPRGQWSSEQWLVLPLWLFLPAAIPPVLWWFRRRPRNARGFSVETTSVAAESNG